MAKISSTLCYDDYHSDLDCNGICIWQVNIYEYLLCSFSKKSPILCQHSIPSFTTWMLHACSSFRNTLVVLVLILVRCACQINTRIAGFSSFFFWFKYVQFVFVFCLNTFNFCFKLPMYQHVFLFYFMFVHRRDILIIKSIFMDTKI